MSRSTPPRRTTDAAPPPLIDGVAGRIVDLIEQHQLTPGDRLPPERQLAAELGVGRQGIREGLTVLRVYGLIDIRHGSGIHLIRELHDVVPPIAGAIAAASPHLPELSEASSGLESYATRLACVRRTAEDLGAMSNAIAQMSDEVSAGQDGVGGDRAFHQAIVEASHNSVLIGLVRQLAPGVAEIANASLARKGQPERSLATHRAIFEAIAVRDADQAGDLMAEHLLITGGIDLPARLSSTDFEPEPATADEPAQ